MTDRQKVLGLSVIVLTMAICVSVTLTVYLLYKTALEEETQRLTETVQSHAGLIESISRFGNKFCQDYPGGPFESTLEQIREAHKQNEGLGVTGEFTLAVKKKDQIHFLLNCKHLKTCKPQPIPMMSKLAEPMRLALSGQSGSVIGLDYRGEYVLAAYEPVKEMGLGLVAKIDLQEVRRPFIRVIVIVGCATLFVILLSATVLLQFNPFLHKLEQSNKKFQATFEQAAVGLAHVGIDGKWLKVNNKLCEIIGYSKEEILTKTFQDITHPDDLEEDLALADKLIRGEDDTYSMEKRYYRKNGSIVWINLTVAVVRDAEGHPDYFVSVIEDIQERKSAEEMLKTTSAMLKQSNKDLEDFVYIASHDLKEPLRGIVNYSSFLIEDYADKLDSEGKVYINTIKKLARRLTEFIEDLLTYSRVGSLEYAFQLTDLNSLVHDVVDTLKQAIEQKSIDVRITGTLPAIYCDKVQMREVYYNLICNAIKYNDKENKWLEIGIKSSAEKNSENIFYVRDNGIGIKEKHKEKIFIMFKRLHGRDQFGGGSGAGLAIVKKIIERHKGKIWIESVYGQGTTFYFTVGSKTK